MKKNTRQDMVSLFLTLELLVVISLWSTLPGFGIPLSKETVQCQGSLSSSTFVILFKPQTAKGDAKPRMENAGGESELLLEAEYASIPASLCLIVLPVFGRLADAFDETPSGISYAYCDAARAPPDSIRS